MGSTNLPDDPKRPDARRDLPNPEAALGGADDVQKTTYVTGSGTDPERRLTSREPAGRTGGGRMGLGGWILIAVVVGIALFYGASLFR